MIGVNCSHTSETMQPFCVTLIVCRASLRCLPSRVHRTKKTVHVPLSLKTSSALVLSSLVLALAGCAQEDKTSEDVNEPTLGDIREITRETQVTRPIDAYLPSTSEILQIAYFQLDAVNRCFAEHGVVAQRVVNPTDLTAFTNGSIRGRATRARLWGFFDTTNAAQYGYREPPGEPRMLMEDHVGDFDIGDLYIQCLHKVENDTPAQADSMDFAHETVLPERGPRVPLNDSRYVAAVSKWSTCMKERGFDYSEPHAAILDGQKAISDTANSQEIATATADIECKLSTNLVGIGLAVQTAYDKQYIDTHQEALTQFRNDLDTYIRGAAT